MTENSRPSWHDILQMVTELDGSDFDDVAVEYEDVSIRLSRGVPEEDAHETQSATQRGPAAASAPAETVGSGESAEAPGQQPTQSNETQSPQGTAVTSPMVGVFYRSPSPGAEPFVSEGDTIEADTTVGIIEVMKLMNPVPAGVAGTVSSFTVGDAESVEFGQHLMYVLPEGS